MTPSPQVSVIIPCFNLGEYLDEAVDSVLAQTCQDFEILILDDGSTDPETQRLLERYDRPKTRTYRTANRGLAAARNYLIERARGEYLCALDADDKLHPEYLATTLSPLATDPTLTFVSTWLQAFGQEEWPWRQDRCDLPMLLAEDTVTTAALVRRAAVLAVGGYDENMPAQGDEDWDLWIRLVKAGYRGTIIPETLFYYRRRPGSMSTVCVEGDTHLNLVAYLVRKHRDSYREHLLEVLSLKDRGITDLRRHLEQTERDIETRLRPEVERRRSELRALERRLEHAGEVREAKDAASRLAQEVAALRSSMSWRLTRPLRAAYDRLLRLRSNTARRRAPDQSPGDAR